MNCLKQLVALALVACLLHVGNAASQKWWQTASFYQIYPRSFKDSDGNGIGDLKGVTQQLAYLKEIGIDATWLSPIFTSPMADFGYDIANFTEIDPMFGTMTDFEQLLQRAKELGVRIILDFVPNHSSDECEWFKKSLQGDAKYADYYVWHPGKMVNGSRQPPTNWISVFRGSTWTWREERQAYYLHQFHAKQPDLNYRNPAVREEMKNVLRFWLDKGVYGFRVDAVPHSYEAAADAEGNFPDEPRNEQVSDPEDYTYLEHIYTTNQPETLDLVYDFRTVLDEYNDGSGDDRIIMTEAYAPIEVLMQYYGNETMEGAQMPFNFELISYLNKDSDAYFYEQKINGWLQRMPAGKTANWVMGNHDQSRVASRMGEDRVDIINTLLLTLPGCSVNYQGEELGMSDVYISWEDTMDPQACQSNPNEYERLTRDPVRTPFHWNDEKNAGFSEADSTWLPVANNSARLNVKRERGIALSHLNVYKQLQQLRDEAAFLRGTAEVKALNKNVLAIKRSLVGESSYLVLLNIMDELQQLDMSHFFSSGLGKGFEYMLVTDKSMRRKGDKTSSNVVTLMPKEATVLRIL